MANGKRKRDLLDQSGPNAPPPPPSDYSTQVFESQYLQHEGEGDLSLAEALAQHNAEGDHIGHEPGTNGQSVTDTASAALHYSMTVPVSTEETFLAQTTQGNNDRHPEPNFDLDTSTTTQGATNSYTDFTTIDQLKETPPPAPVQPLAVTQPGQTPPTEGSPTSANKPNVGSDEWHKVRRDNHKEGTSPIHITLPTTPH